MQALKVAIRTFTRRCGLRSSREKRETFITKRFLSPHINLFKILFCIYSTRTNVEILSKILTVLDMPDFNTSIKLFFKIHLKYFGSAFKVPLKVFRIFESKKCSEYFYSKFSLSYSLFRVC